MLNSSYWKFFLDLIILEFNDMQPSCLKMNQIKTKNVHLSNKIFPNLKNNFH